MKTIGIPGNTNINGNGLRLLKPRTNPQMTRAIPKVR